MMRASLLEKLTIPTITTNRVQQNHLKTGIIALVHVKTYIAHRASRPLLLIYKQTNLLK